MDLVRFEAAASTLLESLGDRLSPETQESVRTLLWGGEEGLVADGLASVLVDHRTPINFTERDLLHELLYVFDLEDSDARYYPSLWNRDQVMASLNVVGAE
ncbi:MAG: hypothetical protein H0X35_04830 [Pseudonocardiales bacterium]|nr:hypothetical protein [Pseudonocardiales bacterium]